MDAREVSRRLLLKINKLRLASELCDVTLMVGDVLLPAHRVVLASSSQFFTSMLTKEEPAATFQINGITASEMLRVLDFMYTGQIALNKANITATRTIATHLQVDLLLEACDRFENKPAPTNARYLGGGAKNRPCKLRRTNKKQSLSDLSPGESSSQLDASSPAPSGTPETAPASRSHEIVACLSDITHSDSMDASSGVMGSHMTNSTTDSLPQTGGIHVIIEQAVETLTGEELECVVVNDKQVTELLPVVGYEAAMECPGDLETETAQNSSDQPASTVLAHVQHKCSAGASSGNDKPHACTNIDSSCQRTHPCLSLIKKGKEKPKNIHNAVVLAQTELSADQLISVVPESPGLVSSGCREPSKMGFAEEVSLVNPGKLDEVKKVFPNGDISQTIISASDSDDRTQVLESWVPLVDSFETLNGSCGIELTNFHDYCSAEAPMDTLKSAVDVIDTEPVDGITCGLHDNYIVSNDGDLNLDDDGNDNGMSSRDESPSPGERQCEWCSYVYRDQENYRSHVKRKHSEKMYKCKHCPRRFISRERRDIHMDICQIPNVDGRFLCTQCDYTAAKLNNVVEHFRSKHRTSSLIQCKQCDRSFVNSLKYYEHAFQAHGLDVSQLPSKVRIHQCHICEYQTTRHAALRLHQQKHTNIQCQVCQKALSSGSALLRHMTQLHGNITPYKCDMCDHSTLYKSTHEAHLYRIHRIITAKKDVVHQCQHCDFTHVKLPMLRKHVQQRHSDVRPFLCSFCPQSFKNKVLLTTHEHRHQGNRPYKCVQCSYAGLSRAGLLQHLKMAHSTEKPFCCELCGHATKTLGNLNKHKKVCTIKYEGKQTESDKTEVDFFEIGNLL